MDTGDLMDHASHDDTEPAPGPSPSANPAAVPTDAHASEEEACRAGVDAVGAGAARDPSDPAVEPAAAPAADPAAEPVAATAWMGYRWRRLFEELTPPEAFAGALELIRKRRVGDIAFEPGEGAAIVRAVGGKRISLRLSIKTLSHEEWERVLEGFDEQPAVAAKLLAGAAPRDIEDHFARVGVRLFPVCEDLLWRQKDSMAGKGVDRSDWDDIACALALAIGQRLETEPLLLFTLRGMPSASFLERLRQRRATRRSLQGTVLAYTQRAAPSAETAAGPLAQSIEGFWSAGEALEDLDTTVAAPALSHPLLRRLGPSPFQDARFPLVGLLASCYDVLSERAMREATGETGADEPAGPAAGGGAEEDV